MLAVALSVAVMIVSVSVVVGFKLEIRNKITGFTGAIQVMRFADDNSFESYPIEESDSARNAIQQLTFVENVHAFATKAAILKSEHAWEGVVIKGVESDYDWTFLKKQLIKGRVPNFHENDREIMLSAKQASLLDIDTGQQAMLFFVQDPPIQKAVNVVGIFSTELEEIDTRFMVADIGIIQNVNEWDSNVIGGYEVSLTSNNIDSLEAWTKEIRYSISEYQNAKSVIDRYPQIFDWLTLLDMNIVIIMILMIGVAIVNMVTVLLILILERTQMVGVLKSMGLNAASIRRVFVYNAGWFIILGMAIGNAVGIGILVLENEMHLINISPDTYYISKVPIAFSWFYFLMINLGTFVICLVAMVIPSLMVSRISPVKALRFN